MMATSTVIYQTVNETGEEVEIRIVQELPPAWGPRKWAIPIAPKVKKPVPARGPDGKFIRKKHGFERL